MNKDQDLLGIFAALAAIAAIALLGSAIGYPKALLFILMLSVVQLYLAERFNDANDNKGKEEH